MIHQGQGLPFGLEPRHYLASVHAGFDDLQGHLAAEGLFLRRHVHDAHAAFANLLQQLVGTDLGAGEFDTGAQSRVDATPVGEAIRENYGPSSPMKNHGFNSFPKCTIVTADLLQVVHPRSRRLDLPGDVKNRLFIEMSSIHGCFPACAAKPFSLYFSVREPGENPMANFGDYLEFFSQNQLTAESPPESDSSSSNQAFGVSPIRSAVGTEMPRTFAACFASDQRKTAVSPTRPR